MASTLRRAGWTLIALLGVVLVWTGIVLMSVRADLRSAERQVEQAQDAEDPRAAAPRLASAAQELAAAERRLAQPGPRVAARLPVLGRTVSAVHRTTSASRAVVTSAAELLTAVPDDPLVDGRLDVRALTELAELAERGAERTGGPVGRLADVQLGLVPGFVAGPVRDARAELAPIPQSLARASGALGGLSALLGADQPRSVLVMLQNNAELRGTGGIVTVLAQATAQDGRLDIGAFRDVEDVADEADAVRRVPVPADYRALWGPFLADSTLWVNVNMTPDVPTASSVLADVAVASGLPRPDAVLWFDVRAIAALLDVTGPVRLADGTRLTEDNAVRVLLSDAYAGATDTREGQAARRAALRRAADGVLGRLFGTGSLDAPVSRVARTLTEAVAGRHLALWSGDPQTQQQLLAGGLAGQVRAGDGDLSSIAVQNFGGGDRQGNKLDYYARRQVSVRVVVDDDHADVEQEFALRNTAPAQGLPSYVAGRVDPGTTRNYVALALPDDAQDATLLRGTDPVRSAVSPSGDHAVVVDGVALAPGATATWTLRYRLPITDGRYSLRLVPQPLAVDGGLRVEVTGANGRRLEGREVKDGVVILSAAFTARRTLLVEVDRPGRLSRAADAVRRFWNEPVRLP